MAKELVTDELWETIEPLLPPEAPKPRGGRPRIEDRAALTGIVFVLKSGIPWEMLPQEMGCGSGITCWRRLREWQEAGVWERLHRTLLDRLGEADLIDWERASVDSASIPAKSKRGAQKPQRIRRIRERRARSATLFRTEKGSRSGSRSPRSSPPPIPTTRCSSRSSSTP
jgi:transposase